MHLSGQLTLPFAWFSYTCTCMVHMHVHVHVHAYIPELVVDSILQGDFYLMFEISVDCTNPAVHLAFHVQCTSMYHCTLEYVDHTSTFNFFLFFYLLNQNVLSAGMAKRIKVESTSAVLNYSSNNTSVATNSSTSISGDRKSSKEELQPQQVQQLTHSRINGHSQRIQSCATTISIKSNTNNNSSLSLVKQPLSAITSSSCTLDLSPTNGTSNAANGVLHLIPGSTASSQPVFVLDEASQQKLLSLLAASSGGGCGHGRHGDGDGDGGGVATCSLAADASVLVATVNNHLKVQQQSSAASEVPGSETALCYKGESSACSYVREEQIVCDQVSSSCDRIDITRDFGDVRDVEGGGGGQNAQSLNMDPLMLFLASAAEEVKSMMDGGGAISANEEGQGGKLHAQVETSVECVSANEGGLPLGGERKEVNTACQLYGTQATRNSWH